MAKKLKIKDYLRYISNSNEKTASAIKENNRLLTEQIEIEQQKLKHEKETKDRVDISLKEYEQLKADLDKYKEKSLHYQQIFDSLKLGCCLDFIDPHSFVIATTKDPMRLQTRVHIQFDCNGMFEFQHETPSRLYQHP